MWSFLVKMDVVSDLESLVLANEMRCGKLFEELDNASSRLAISKEGIKIRNNRGKHPPSC